MILKIIKLAIFQEITLIVILLFTPSGKIYPQVNDLYYNAVNLYNAGNIDSAYCILDSCINNVKLFRKTSKSTRADIYRLSALSSIKLVKPDIASLRVEKLLAFKPYYKKEFKQDDGDEFRILVEGFSVQPKYVIGVNFFKNYSQISLSKVFAPQGSDNTQNITITSEYGGGFVVENTITKRFSLGLGVNLFKQSFEYTGSHSLFSLNDLYKLDFLYVETPVYANYKMREDKKLKPYFQLGIISRYYIKSGNSLDAPDRLRSSKYGPYYMKENNSPGANGVLTLFFRNFENLDLSLGSGITYNFNKSCFDFNIGFFPLRFNTHPLKGVSDLDTIKDEWFTYANETIVVDLRKVLRFNLSYKYFLSFKAF